jgi:GNAT superfamily N-acetyltransferase
MTSFVTQNHNLQDVCDLLARFGQEGVYKRPVNRPMVEAVLTAPTVMCVVAYRNGKAVGIVMAMVFDHPLFEGRVTTDLVIYVTPEHRGSLIAARMIKMMERWGQEQKAEGLMLGQSTQIGDMRRVMKFYERLGYSVTGFNCMKEF